MKKKCSNKNSVVNLKSEIANLSRDTDIAIQEEQSKLYKNTLIKTGQLARQYFIQHIQQVVDGICRGNIQIFGDYPVHGEGDIEIKLHVKAPTVQKKMEKVFNVFAKKQRAMVIRKKKEEKQKIKELLKGTRAE